MADLITYKIAVEENGVPVAVLEWLDPAQSATVKDLLVDLVKRAPTGERSQNLRMATNG